MRWLDSGKSGVLLFYYPTPLGGVRRIQVALSLSTDEVAMENDSAIRRLKTVEGHLRGVIRMVEEDAYCIDVIRQIQAVEAALNKVSSKILEDHLNSCVITAIQGNDRKERERVLKEITEVFEMSTKV
jgi:CsoR family transcriptional regulator, copper-sensing transcriptional repressor